MADKPVKIRHTSRSLERHILATRERVWAALLDAIESGVGYVVEGDPAPHGAGAVLHLPLGDGPPLVETVLSFEPPWRRSYKVEGEATGLALYEGTFVLRDDGPECHLSWGVVIDPEPSEAGWAFLDLAMTVIGGLMDQVVARCEA